MSASRGSLTGERYGCVEYGRGVTERSTELTRWTIHGERVIDDTRRARWSIAEVELPDGVRFEQYVLRLPKAAIVVVLDDDDRVLMMWRHRFIIDRWVWELPGGYVDEAEDPAATAAREVEEETGWRPRSIAPLLSFQPMVGTADAENLLFLARGADYVGTPEDINEAERIGWIPLDEVLDYIARGEIVGAASVVGLIDVLARRQRGELKA
jgi:8-oxo-dGTP pyrophosphatase MutT (NUDIX family)